MGVVDRGREMDAAEPISLRLASYPRWLLGFRQPAGRHRHAAIGVVLGHVHAAQNEPDVPAVRELGERVALASTAA